MNWRRVTFAVGFAVCVTAAGFGLPFGLGTVLLWPGVAVGRLIGNAGDVPRETWLRLWVPVYAQLFSWAVVGEIVRILWNQLRKWEAQRVVRA